MATWSNRSKNVASWTERSKNTATWSNRSKSLYGRILLESGLGFLLTEAGEYLTQESVSYQATWTKRSKS